LLPAPPQLILSRRRLPPAVLGLAAGQATPLAGIRRVGGGEQGNKLGPLVQPCGPKGMVPIKATRWCPQGQPCSLPCNHLAEGGGGVGPGIKAGVREHYLDGACYSMGRAKNYSHVGGGGSELTPMGLTTFSVKLGWKGIVRGSSKIYATSEIRQIKMQSTLVHYGRTRWN
jgi:hypothetical protein